MHLNPVIDKFYLSILDYSGLKLDNNIIVNKNEKLGDITIDNKSLTLPYFENLKNPDNKLIFHPLNENYLNPENAIFTFFKKRVVLEINLKLSSLIINLISIAADSLLQQKIKSSKLIDIISNIGEVDHPTIEHFLNIVKNSKKVNDEAFLLDIYLKKNGSINDVPYAAIGKINFILFNELQKSLDTAEQGYKVFNYKTRKKDILALINIFNVIFPDIQNKDKYSEGTDNKIFRYLNILLKTTYIVAKQINDIADILAELKEPNLDIDGCRSNLDWTNYLEDLYGMATEIRLIPSQVDITIEANKLKLDESKAKVEQQQDNPPPQFNPNQVPQVQQVQTPQVQQVPQQPTVLSPEDIIRGNMGYPAPQPMVYQQPVQPSMSQQYVPTWVQQETMRSNPNMMQPNMMMQPNIGPPMQTGAMMPPNVQMQPSIGMPMQPGLMMPINMQMQPSTMIQPNQPSGLQINPYFIGPTMTPWR